MSKASACWYYFHTIYISPSTTSRDLYPYPEGKENRSTVHGKLQISLKNRSTPQPAPSQLLQWQPVLQEFNHWPPVLQEFNRWLCTSLEPTWWQPALPVCTSFYIYKLVNVYLDVSFTHADKWKTFWQSLDDESSLIESQCMFGQHVESKYSIGDVLQVSAVYAKTYQNTVQLTSAPSSKCVVNK